MIHFFDQPFSHIALPERFTYPFNYTPHPLCVLAAEEVKAYISTKKEWQEELTLGKMFGVLIVQTQEEGSSSIGYLAAFPAIWQERICIRISSHLFTICCNHRDSLK